MSRQLQVDVYEYDPPLDYRPFYRLLWELNENPPDAIVNLGDFTETFYGDYCPLPRAYKNLHETGRLVKLRGNHDRDDGIEFINLDGVRYEHGHKLGTMKGADASVDGYIEMLRENTHGITNLVHGHTHVPNAGWPLDVGSVTFSRTYGEIVDGIPYLRELVV
jgi:predicted phosphodiesterase